MRMNCRCASAASRVITANLSRWGSRIPHQEWSCDRKRSENTAAGVSRRADAKMVSVTARDFCALDVRDADGDFFRGKQSHLDT